MKTLRTYRTSLCPEEREVAMIIMVMVVFRGCFKMMIMDIPLHRRTG